MTTASHQATGVQLPPQASGLLADFADGAALMAGVEALRKAGYKRLDALSPVPGHGIDDALGLRPTRLPWLVFFAGLTGLATAVALQYFTNAVDYPFRISGKPLFSIPANVPVSFELTILFSAFGTFFGMLILNRLWSFYNPVLESDLFRGVTNDRFVLSVQAADPLFDPTATAAQLRSAGASNTELIRREVEPPRVPRPVWLGLTVVALLLLVPPFLIAKARVSKSEDYPVRLELGMRNQDKVKTQTASKFFADGLAMRPPAGGSVAHGAADLDDRIYEGAIDGQFVEKFPLEVNAGLMARGRERFNIYCITCHGAAGLGNGTTNLRVDALRKTRPGELNTWVKPSSLSDPKSNVRDMTDGQIFHTISYGARSMKGYAARITPEDRWAIVLYVRALQKSQSATPADMAENKAAVTRVDAGAPAAE